MLNSIKKKRFVSILMILIFFSISIIVAFISLDTLFFSKQVRELTLSGAKDKLIEREALLHGFLQDAERSLQSLRNSLFFQNYIENPETKKTLEHFFLSFAQNSSAMMQVRYLDFKGREQIRIERLSEGSDPFITAKGKLQDKSSRYYFQNAVLQHSEKVLYSAIDLNKDNGELERPFKPTLRALLPVFHKNTFDGVLVINYFFKSFLDDFVSLPLYTGILINEKGDILKHSDDMKSWSHYTNSMLNFRTLFPEYAQSVLNHDQAGTASWVSRRFNLPIDGGLIYYVELKPEVLKEQEQIDFRRKISVFFIVLIVTFLMSIFLSKLAKKFLSDQKELEYAQKLFKGLFDQEAVGIAYFALNGQFIRANKKLCAMLHYSEAELHTLTFQEITHKDDIKEDLEYVQGMLEGVIKNFQMNKRYIRKDGEIAWVRISGSLNRDGKGTPESFVAVIEDINDQVEQKEMLINQSRLAAMGEMISMIAHQWRQPLAAINSVVMNIKIKMTYDNDDQIHLSEKLDRIEEYTHKLSQTIKNFQSFLQIDKEKEPMALPHVISEMMTIFNSSVEYDAKITIKKIDAVTIMGFSREFIQAMISLLENAVESVEMIQNIREPKIEIATRLEGDHVIISVCDNGEGIDPATENKIFEPYFSTKKDKNGTGLGLYLTKIIIEDHFGGSLYFIRQEHGVCFEIKLTVDH